MNRVRGALALAACVLLVGLIGLAEPGTEPYPRHHDAALTEWGDNGRYAARVAEVAVARRVEPAPGTYGSPVEAPPGAVAVAIRLEHRVHRETVGIATLATLESREGGAARALSTTSMPSTGPGFVGAGSLIFIVTEDSVPGARLVLPAQRQLFTGLAVDTIRVDLELTDGSPTHESVRLRPDFTTVAT